MAEATLKQIADFFIVPDANGKRSGGLTAFAAEWKALTDKDKDQIKAGIGDSTYNYAA